MSSMEQKSASGGNKDHGVLYIGMDLGTSRTSVSASNGVRETVYSVVGYPKDVVSRKLLQRDVLFGKEAIDKRLSLRMFKPLEKGVLKYSGDPGQDNAKDNLKAAQDLIGEAIRLAKPRKDELVYCVIGAPAQASIKNKEAILAAARAHVDSVMLCSEPFSVAYGLEWLEDVLVIDIGAGTTDLCRMHGTMPEDADQISFAIAGDAIDEKLAQLMEKVCPGAQFSMQMVKDLKERYAFVGEPAERATVDLPVNGKPTTFDLTDQVREACMVLVDPIVDGGSMIKGLDFAIEKAMKERMGGGKVIRIEEPIYGGANGALKIAHDMPPEFWEKLR
jgi:rod shape-determining protein MreB